MNESEHRPDETGAEAVDVVVVHHRNWPGIKRTIQSLERQSVPVHILVVDSASGDGSPGRIRAAFPHIEVIDAPSNRGYAASVNLGLHIARSPVVLVVTHEVVLEAGALASMEACARGNVAAVGPVLWRLDRPDEVFSSGGVLDSQHLPVHLTDLPARARAVDWLDGSCMLLQRRAVMEVGPMDEAYFLYFEEVDYATRLRGNGWSLVCTPEARVMQQPARLPRALFTRNQLRFLQRSRGRRAVASGLRRLGMQAAGHARRRQFARALRLVAGIVGYLLGIPPTVLVRLR